MSEHDLEEKFTVDDGGATVPSSSVEDPATPAGGMPKKKKADVKKSVDPKADKISTATPGMKEEAETDEVEIVEEEIITIDESISKMFEGMDLSEEFKNKVTLVFEAAVHEAATVKANAMAEEYAAKVDQEMQESVDSTVNTIIENLDSYLDYVVEEWMKENELAVENGLRNEITESFIKGMQQVFTEHYIEVPEEKYDVMTEMQTKIDDLQSKLDEQVQKNMDLNEESVVLKKQNIFADIAEGLADTDAEKFAVMVEDISYTSAESYENKLKVVKDNYFRKEIAESTDTLEDSVDEVSLTENTVMGRYADALSKSKKF